MELSLLEDESIMQSIMTDSEIWERIRVDGVDASDFKATIPDNMVIMASSVCGVVIGLHMFSFKDDRVMYHIALLKKYRKKYGRVFSRQGINWFFQNTKYDTLETEIPVTNQSVINYGVNLGCKKVGIVEKGVQVNGEAIDLQVLRLHYGFTE